MQDDLYRFEDDYIDAVIEEVEKELLLERQQQEAELYERQLEEELNVLVRYANACVLCDTHIEYGSENEICATCVNSLNLYIYNNNCVN